MDRHEGRLVVGGDGYDVFIGRGSCPVTGGSSRWAVPRCIWGRSREEREAKYRRWLWEEIVTGRVRLTELVRLHGRRLGVRERREGWHAGVLEAAAMWAMIEQARRLAVVAEEKRSRGPVNCVVNLRCRGEDGWEAVREGHRRGPVRGELEEGLDVAREMVRERGGGEVAVLNRTGKVVEVIGVVG